MIGELSLEEHFKVWAPEQCIVNIRSIIEEVVKIKPKIYLEIGAAGLGTFRIFESLLPPSPQGLAIGVDNTISENAIERWKDYKPVSGCDVSLIEGDSASEVVKKEVIEKLAGRKVDYLLIDGLHTYEHVKSDWEDYAPLVRSGGIVTFHDYNVNTKETENVGKLVHELIDKGYRAYLPPYSNISSMMVYIQ